MLSVYSVRIEASAVVHLLAWLVRTLQWIERWVHVAGYCVCATGHYFILQHSWRNIRLRRHYCLTGSLERSQWIIFWFFWSFVSICCFDSCFVVFHAWLAPGRSLIIVARVPIAEEDWILILHRFGLISGAFSAISLTWIVVKISLVFVWIFLG